MYFLGVGVWYSYQYNYIDAIISIMCIKKYLRLVFCFIGGLARHQD